MKSFYFFNLINCMKQTNSIGLFNALILSILSIIIISNLPIVILDSIVFISTFLLGISLIWLSNKEKNYWRDLIDILIMFVIIVIIAYFLNQSVYFMVTLVFIVGLFIYPLVCYIFEVIRNWKNYIILADIEIFAIIITIFFAVIIGFSLIFAVIYLSTAIFLVLIIGSMNSFLIGDN